MATYRRRRQDRNEPCNKRTMTGVLIIAMMTTLVLLILISVYTADPTEEYHRLTINQLRSGLNGKPVAIRCMSAIVKDWSPSPSSLSQLPPSKHPFDADCLNYFGDMLAAVKCHSRRDFTTQRWALNADGQLVNYEGHRHPNPSLDQAGTPPPGWLCLLESTAFKDSLRGSRFGPSPYLQFVQCSHLPSTSDGNFSGKFNLHVMVADDFPFRGVRYEDERNLRKKKHILFAISSPRHPDLCFTCPRRRGDLADKYQSSLVTLTPCDMKAKEQVLKEQLFYLDGECTVN